MGARHRKVTEKYHLASEFICGKNGGVVRDAARSRAYFKLLVLRADHRANRGSAPSTWSVLALVDIIFYGYSNDYDLAPFTDVVLTLPALPSLTCADIVKLNLREAKALCSCARAAPP